MTRDDDLPGLAALVRGQHGVIDREQAFALGLTPRQVEWRLTSGRWVAVHRGVYLTSPGRDDRLVRTSAAVLACGEGTVLARASAAFEHGLRTTPPHLVEVLTPATRRIVPPTGVDVRRSTLVAGRTAAGHRWPPLTTVEDTVLDVAADGTADEAVAIAALACQRGMTWDGRLLEVLAARRAHPWRALLVGALHDIGGGAESTMEVRYVRDVERPHGLPRGRPQLSRRGGRVRHDVGYEEQRTLVELDGLAFHSSTGARVRDGRRDRGSLVDGWATLRAFWPDVAVTPCELARDVGLVLGQRGWSGSARPCRRRDCLLRPSGPPRMEC